MIEKQKSLLQTEETEKVSKKPLSNEELSSLIKASNNKKFNEAELKVKKMRMKVSKKLPYMILQNKLINKIKKKLLSKMKKVILTKTNLVRKKKKI